MFSGKRSNTYDKDVIIYKYFCEYLERCYYGGQRYILS